MRDFENEKSNTATAISAGMHLGEPREVADGLAVVIVPEGAKMERVDLNEFEAKYAAHPRRKIGTRSLATAESFIAYVNAHKTGATAIYASKDNTKFLAVFNDHEPTPPKPTPEQVEVMRTGMAAAEGVEAQATEAEVQGSDGPTSVDLDKAISSLIGVAETAMHLMGGRAGHGDFKATYDCPQSVEWKRWMHHSQHNADSDGKRGMKQEAFMQFLEDNLLDITQPESAKLLQAVHSFEAKKDVKFKSATRLQDGSVSFAYMEDVAEVAQEGKLSLPEQFTITIPVFDGGLKYDIDARLRYRISGGGLVLWYELIRPHKVLEHAFNTVFEQVTKGITGTPAYNV